MGENPRPAPLLASKCACGPPCRHAPASDASILVTALPAGLPAQRTPIFPAFQQYQTGPEHQSLRPFPQHLRVITHAFGAGNQRPMVLFAHLLPKSMLGTASAALRRRLATQVQSGRAFL